MSIPPNQFRRDHPWTRFVLLDSSAWPVPSQAKVTHSLTLSLKKNPTMHMQKHWDFNRRRIALLSSAGWQIGWFWLHIHWEISLHTDLKKQIKRCIYSLAPCLCNVITLAVSALTIHKVGAGRPLIDVSSKSMPTNFHSISLRSKPGLLQRNGQIYANEFSSREKNNRFENYKRRRKL